MKLIVTTITLIPGFVANQLENVLLSYVTIGSVVPLLLIIYFAGTHLQQVPNWEDFVPYAVVWGVLIVALAALPIIENQSRQLACEARAPFTEGAVSLHSYASDGLAVFETICDSEEDVGVLDIELTHNGQSGSAAGVIVVLPDIEAKHNGLMRFELRSANPETIVLKLKTGHPDTAGSRESTIPLSTYLDGRNDGQSWLPIVVELSSFHPEVENEPIRAVTFELPSGADPRWITASVRSLRFD